jgi:hypothetical protein
MLRVHVCEYATLTRVCVCATLTRVCATLIRVCVCVCECVLRKGAAVERWGDAVLDKGLSCIVVL